MSGSPTTLRKTTLRLGERRLTRAEGDFDVHFFRDLSRATSAMAISVGPLDLGAPLLARVHSSCATSECLMGRDCDCAEQLEAALATMAEAGRGVVFYLMQEGRGAGLTAKARDRMMVQASGHRLTTFEAYAAMGLPADLRRYDLVAPMARLLGVRAPIRLLTNNPEKASAVEAALATEKIEVDGLETIQGPSSPFNRHYLDAKRGSGHALAPSEGQGVRPPDRVRVFEPVPIQGDLRRIVTASYFLPIDLAPRSTEPTPDIEWFRLSVVYDRDREDETIVLSRDASWAEGADAEPPPVVRMRLLDRLPFRSESTRGPLDADSPPVGRPALRAALERIRAAGRGAVVVRLDDRDQGDETGGRPDVG